ncbi:MAG: hypothetical protein ACRCXZ_05975 [Patescibacteria group bacterium]
MSAGTLMAEFGLNSAIDDENYLDFILDLLCADYLYKGDNVYHAISAKSLNLVISNVRQLIQKNEIKIIELSFLSKAQLDIGEDNSLTICIPRNFANSVRYSFLRQIEGLCSVFYQAQFLYTWLNQSTSLGKDTIIKISNDYSDNGLAKLESILSAQSRQAKEIYKYRF